MNKLWNLVVKLWKMDDPEYWETFWTLEIFAAIFAVGATTIVSFIVNMMVDMEPYTVEVLLAWVVIFIVTERILLEGLLEVINEDERERRYHA